MGRRNGAAGLRRLAIVSVIVAPLVGAGVGVACQELGLAPQTRFLGFLPILVVVSMIRRLTAFPCPRCGKPFSKNERNALHLSNKQCLHCAVDVSVAT